MIGGNIVSRTSAVSFNELNISRLAQAERLSDTQLDIEVNHFRKTDFIQDGNAVNIGSFITLPTKDVFDNFVTSANTFNTGVAQRINQIRRTIEKRLPVAAGGELPSGCTDYRFNYDSTSHTAGKLWYNADGSLAIYSVSDYSCPPDTNMTNINWTNFDSN